MLFGKFSLKKRKVNCKNTRKNKINMALTSQVGEIAITRKGNKRSRWNRSCNDFSIPLPYPICSHPLTLQSWALLPISFCFSVSWTALSPTRDPSRFSRRAAIPRDEESAAIVFSPCGVRSGTVRWWWLRLRERASTRLSCLPRLRVGF